MYHAARSVQLRGSYQQIDDQLGIRAVVDVHKPLGYLRGEDRQAVCHLGRDECPDADVGVGLVAEGDSGLLADLDGTD